MQQYKNYIIGLGLLALLLIRNRMSAVRFIAKFEGIKLNAYQDSAGIWTIGYGNTRNPYTGLPVKQGDKITQAQALDWLKISTASAEGDVKRLVKVPITANQLSALTSLVYNIGAGAFARSTLLRLLNSRTDKNLVAAQFLRWNRAGGKELPGLTLRRKKEADLFLS